VDRYGYVAVAGPDLVGPVLVLVPGQLEPRAVAGEAHEDVDRLVADGDPPDLLEAELLVEVNRAIDLLDAVAGVDQLAHGPGGYARGAARARVQISGSDPDAKLARV